MLPGRAPPTSSVSESVFLLSRPGSFKSKDETLDKIQHIADSLDDALNRLAEFDERKSKIVELRFFAGLSIEETAEILAVSPGTVMRDWTLTKAWLRRAIHQGI